MTRGLWDREMVALVLLAAVMPMALAWLWYGGSAAMGRLVLTLFLSGFWHLVFMLARAQPPSFAGALTALAVAMLAPVDLSLFQLVLGISFGAVMAELVMGGWGRNVLHPATVTLAFLGFGFPAAAWPGHMLTTIRQPIRRMIREAVDIVIDQMNNPGQPARVTRFSGALILRGTVRGAGAG